MFPTNVSAIKERIKAGRMTGKRTGSVRREKVRGVKVEGTKQREGKDDGGRTIGCTSRELKVLVASTTAIISVVIPASIGVVDPDPNPQNRKKFKKFMFFLKGWKLLMELFEIH
jgi:hypothetical protein